MSLLTLRVELPTYSHSFHVQVTPLSTIRDVKLEIAKVCPGSPSPDGQRVIYKGRLLKDEEKVEDVWKSEDSRVVHLAVNPSAWTSSPPSLPSSATPHRSTSVPHSIPTPGQSVHPTTWQMLSSPSHLYPPVPSFPSVPYIQYSHYMALGVLSKGVISLPLQPSIIELEAWRSAARDLYRNRGWMWPSILDDPYPSGSVDPGAVYQPVTLEGLPYLQLVTPHAAPTPAQLHALRVLTHTLSILSITYEPMLYPPVNPSRTLPTNLNQHLQQLGLPAFRVGQNQLVNPNPNDANPLPQPGAGVVEIRAIPLRALMVPLLMLAFRAVLILYFFSPTKRPVFGLLLSVWILYETWNAMRMVLNEGTVRAAEEAGANPAAPNAAPGDGQPVPNPAGAAGINANRPAQNVTPGRSALQGILDYLSTINLAAEDAMLDTDAPHPPPNLAHKAKMFFVLFFMTVYPAAWDRRRTTLRRREGRIRTEANAREAALNDRGQASTNGVAAEQGQTRSEEEAASARAREQLVVRHERRPAWLKEYVNRVQYAEWVDDS